MLRSILTTIGWLFLAPSIAIAQPLGDDAKEQAIEIIRLGFSCQAPPLRLDAIGGGVASRLYISEYQGTSKEFVVREEYQHKVSRSDGLAGLSGHNEYSVSFSDLAGVVAGSIDNEVELGSLTLICRPNQQCIQNKWCEDGSCGEEMLESVDLTLCDVETANNIETVTRMLLVN